MKSTILNLIMIELKINDHMLTHEQCKYEENVGQNTKADKLTRKGI